MFTGSVQKLALVISSPSLYKEKDRNYLNGENYQFYRHREKVNGLTFLVYVSNRPLKYVGLRLR